MSQRREYEPDVAKREQLKAKDAERAQIAELTEAEDFKRVMSEPHGRRFVWRLLSEAGVFRATFNNNSLIMAFNEGLRNYGLKTWAMVQELCPEIYETMVREAKHGRSSSDDGNADNSN